MYIITSFEVRFVQNQSKLGATNNDYFMTFGFLYRFDQHE